MNNQKVDVRINGYQYPITTKYVEDKNSRNVFI